MVSTGFVSTGLGSSVFAGSLPGIGFAGATVLFCAMFYSNMLVLTFPIEATGSALAGSAFTGSLFTGCADGAAVVFAGAGLRSALNGFDSAFGESSFLIQDASVFLGAVTGWVAGLG